MTSITSTGINHFLFNKVKIKGNDAISQPINLLEIQIWVDGVNVSRDVGTVASASSTHTDGEPGRLIDDIVDGGDRAHTTSSYDEWFLLTLSNDININHLESVVIYNRVGTYGSRIDGCSFQLYNDDYLLYSNEITIVSDYYRFDGPAITNVTDFSSTPATDKIIIKSHTFNKVKLIGNATKNQSLHVNEIQIWINGVNIALPINGTSASSSSVAQGGFASYLTDEIVDVYNSAAHTGSSYDEWFLLTLTSAINTNNLESIVIYNRQGSNEGTIAGSKLQLYSNNDLLYSNEITIVTDYYRFDGQSIDNVTFSSTDSSTNIIEVTSGLTTTIIYNPTSTTQISLHDSFSTTDLNVLNLNDFRVVTNCINAINPLVLDISSSGFLQIPKGTDANIPRGGIAASGQIRYNTTHNDYQGFQGYSDGNWTILSGGERSMNNRTRIETFKTGTFNKLVFRREYIDQEEVRTGFIDSDNNSLDMRINEIQIWVNIAGTPTNISSTGTTVANNGAGTWTDLTNLNNNNIVTGTYNDSITKAGWLNGDVPSLKISFNASYNISDLISVVLFSNYDDTDPTLNASILGTSLRIYDIYDEVTSYLINDISKYYRIDGPAIGSYTGFTATAGSETTAIIDSTFNSTATHMSTFEKIGLYTRENENMTITDEARVGIHNTLPLHNLHVGGNLKVTEGVRFTLNYDYYQDGLFSDGTYPEFLTRFLETMDQNYGAAQLISDNGGLSISEYHGNYFSSYTLNQKHQFSIQKATYYPSMIDATSMTNSTQPIVDNSNGYWSFNTDGDTYLWKDSKKSAPSNILFDTIQNITPTINPYFTYGIDTELFFDGTSTSDINLTEAGLTCVKGGEARTIELEFKTSEQNTEFMVLLTTGGNSSNKQFAIMLHYGKIRFNGYGNNYTQLTSKPLNDGVWHHVKITFADSVLTIYIDSIKYNGISSSPSTSIYGNSSLFTGANINTDGDYNSLGHRNNSEFPYIGSLRNVRFYDHVNELIDAYTNKAQTPYYTYSENAVTTFDGTNANAVSLPAADFTCIKGGNARTIELSFKTNDNNENKFLVCTGSTNLNQSFGIRILGGRIAFFGKDNGWLSTISPIVNDGVWHHVKITFENGLMTLYVDHKQYEQVTTMIDTSNASKSYIGANINTTGGANYIGSYNGGYVFNGSIREVYFYDHVYDPIVQSNPYSYLRGIPYYEYGTTDQIYSFNGESSIDLTADGFVSVNHKHVRTIELEFKTSITPNAKMTLISTGTTIYANKDNRTFNLKLSSNGKFTFMGYANDWTSTTSTDLRDGNWHHLRVTFYNERMTLYIDGARYESLVVGGALDNYNGSAIDTIGIQNFLGKSNNSSNVDYYTGDMRNVKFYDHEALLPPIPHTALPTDPFFTTGVDPNIFLSGKTGARLVRSASVLEGNARTIELEFNTSYTTTTMYLVSTGGHQPNEAFNIRIINGRIAFEGDDNNWTSVASPIVTDGKWHHVKITFENSMMTLYVDHVQYEQLTSSTSGSDNYIGSNINTIIGYSQVGGWYSNTSYTFNGSIRNVLFFDYVTENSVALPTNSLRSSNNYTFGDYTSSDTGRSDMTFNTVRIQRNKPSRSGHATYIHCTELQVWIGGANVVSAADTTLLSDGDFTTKFEINANSYIDVALTSTYTIGQLQSVVLYNNSSTEEYASIGLVGCEIQLINTSDSYFTKTIYRSDTIPIDAIKDVYRFDGPAIGGYSGTFATSPSTTLIIGTSVSATGLIAGTYGVSVSTIQAGGAMGYSARFHEDHSCNMDASGGGYFILKLPEPIYALGGLLGWQHNTANQNAQKFQFYASQNGSWWERIGDIDTGPNGLNAMSDVGNVGANPTANQEPIIYSDKYDHRNVTTSVVYGKTNFGNKTSTFEFNNISSTKKYQYFAIIATERALSNLIGYDKFACIAEFRLIIDSSKETPRKLTIQDGGTVIETSTNSHSPDADFSVGSNIIVSTKTISRDLNIYNKTFNEIRLTNYTNNPEMKITELQLWMNGSNIGPEGKAYASTINNSYPITNINDKWLSYNVVTSSGTITDYAWTGTSPPSGSYFSIVFPDSHNIEDIETILLYADYSGFIATGITIELRNFGNVLYTTTTTSDQDYYRVDGPSIGNVSAFAASSSNTSILNSTVAPIIDTITFTYDLSYNNEIAKPNSVYVSDLMGISTIHVDRDLSGVLFNTDNSNNFVIDASGGLHSKGGLKHNADYGIDQNSLLTDSYQTIKATDLDANSIRVISYPCVPPDVDFDFRINSNDTYITDKIGGLRADLNGSYNISNNGIELGGGFVNIVDGIHLSSNSVFEMYFTVNSWTDWGRIFEFSDDESGTNSIGFSRYTSYNALQVKAGISNIMDRFLYDEGSIVGKELHVIIQFTNSDAEIYINGVLITTFSSTTFDKPIYSGVRKIQRIGASRSISYDKTNMNMKFFRMWKTHTLDLFAIADLYAMRDSSFHPTVSIIGSHIALGQSYNYAGANKLYISQCGGIGNDSVSELNYASDYDKGIQFFTNNTVGNNVGGTIALDISANFTNGFGYVGIGKYADSNYLLDISGSLVNMYPSSSITADVRSVFHKSSTTDCYSGININTVGPASMSFLNTDGTVGLSINDNISDISYGEPTIAMNGGSLKPASTLLSAGNLSNNVTHSFNKVKLIRTSGSNYINLFEIQIWVNGSNIALNCTITDSSTYNNNYSSYGPDILNDGTVYHTSPLITEQTEYSHTKFVTIGEYYLLPLSNSTTIHDLESVVIYNRYKSTAAQVQPRIIGCSLQLLYDDEILYTEEITISSKYYRFDGPSIVNVSNFASAVSSTEIINVASELTISSVDDAPQSKSVHIDGCQKIHVTGTITTSKSIYKDVPNSATNIEYIDVATIPLKLVKNGDYGLNVVQTNTASTQTFNRMRIQKGVAHSALSGNDSTNVLYKGLTSTVSHRLDINEFQLWVGGSNVAKNDGTAGDAIATSSSQYSSSYDAPKSNNNVLTQSDRFISQGTDPEPWLDITFNQNYDVNVIQSIVVYNAYDNANKILTSQNMHIELYNSNDDVVYTSNRKVLPSVVWRIDGPAIGSYNGGFYSSNPGSASTDNFATKIVDTDYTQTTTSVIFGVQHEKMDNILEVMNSEGDFGSYNGCFTHPKITVIDSDGNVGINTTAPRPGAKLDVFNAYDSSIAKAFGVFPVGFTMMFSGVKDKVPNGWLLCDGAAYSNTDYPALANIIGYKSSTNASHGGTTSTFKVPNLTERFPILANDSTIYSGLSGVNTTNDQQLGNNVCNTNQLAAHTHSIDAFDASHNAGFTHTLKSNNSLSGVDNANKHLYPRIPLSNNNNPGYTEFQDDMKGNNTVGLGRVPILASVESSSLKTNVTGNNQNYLRTNYHNLSNLEPYVILDVHNDPVLTLSSTGNSSAHRKPMYTVVNFIIYGGVHETTSYDSAGSDKGWAS